MNLPAQYKWLQNLEDMPRTISVALGFYGLQEIVGRGSNRTIISWRDTLNSNGVPVLGYSDDDIPWCGLFAAIVTYMRKGLGTEVVASPLWAQNWAKYGIAVSTPMLGDILVFKRNGGGHVGFYVGEDSTCYHVLGGNQSNKVCITRIEKSRCIAKRRPPYGVTPTSVKVYRLAGNGSISKNEG